MSRTEVETLALEDAEGANDPALSSRRWEFIETAFGSPLPEAYDDVVLAFKAEPMRAKLAVGLLVSSMLIATRVYRDADLRD